MNKTSENVWFSSEFSWRLLGGEGGESPLRTVSAVISDDISVVVRLSEIISVVAEGGSTSTAIFSTRLPIIRSNSEEVVSVAGGSVLVVTAVRLVGEGRLLENNSSGLPGSR